MGCTPPLPKVWLQADFGHNRNSLSHPYSELFISKLMVCESIFRMAQKYLDMLVMYFFCKQQFLVGITYLINSSHHLGCFLQPLWERTWFWNFALRKKTTEPDSLSTGGMQDPYGTLRSYTLLRRCFRFGYPHTVATTLASGAVWRASGTACFRKRYGEGHREGIWDDVVLAVGKWFFWFMVVSNRPGSEG